MSAPAELARRLAREAEAVCRYYLSRGHRQGRYWHVGDAHNTPGRSLYVRLAGADYGPGAAGKWTDAATGEHGDLLDIIHENQDLRGVGEAMDEARAFLSLPRSAPPETAHRGTTNRSDAARRLFAAGIPVPGAPAEAYLREGGITGTLDWPSLRFHPRAYYREHDRAPPQTFPALLASVTDLHGRVTGIQRIWTARIAGF